MCNSPEKVCSAISICPTSFNIPDNKESNKPNSISVTMVCLQGLETDKTYVLYIH